MEYTQAPLGEREEHSGPIDIFDFVTPYKIENKRINFPYVFFAGWHDIGRIPDFGQKILVGHGDPPFHCEICV